MWYHTLLTQRTDWWFIYLVHPEFEALLAADHPGAEESQRAALVGMFREGLQWMLLSLRPCRYSPPTLSAQNPPPCPHLLTTASQPDRQLGTEAGKPGSIATSCPEESLCRKRDSEAERSGRSSQQSRDGVF